jgi:hypothetical protein
MFFVESIDKYLGPLNKDFNQFSLKSNENKNYYKQLEVNGQPLGFCAVSSAVSETRNPECDDEVSLRRLQYNGYVLLELYSACYKLLDLKKPHSIMVHNGRIVEYGAAYYAAKALDIHVRTNEFVGRGIDVFESFRVHDLEYSKSLTTEFIRITDPKVIVRVGEEHLHARREARNKDSFTSHQKTGLVPELVGQVQSGRLISIFTSSDDEFSSISREWDHPVFQNQLESIERLINVINDVSSDAKVVIRMHPNLRGVNNPTVQKYYELVKSNVVVVAPDHPMSSYELLDVSDVVITFGSSIGVESTYWRKPVICLARTLWEDLDCEYYPANWSEVTDLLVSDELPPKSAIGPLRWFAFCLLRGKLPVYFDERAKKFNDKPMFMMRSNFEAKLASKLGEGVTTCSNLYPLFPLNMIGRLIAARREVQQHR